MPEIDGSNRPLLDSQSLVDSDGGHSTPDVSEYDHTAHEASAKSRYGQSVHQVEPKSIFFRVKNFFVRLFSPLSINKRQATVVHRARDVIPEMIPDKMMPLGLDDVDESEQLGKGGQGRVYLTKPKKKGKIHKRPHMLHKDYVVKEQEMGMWNRESTREKKQDAEREVRLQQEAKGTVPIVDAKLDEGIVLAYHKVMMEFGGQDLTKATGLTDEKYLEHLRQNPGQPFRGKAIDEDTCRGIATELFQHLADLHERGVAHRDVKPANILISNQGKVRLADFGIAQEAQDNIESDDPDALKYQGPIGTPHYVAPDIAYPMYSEKVDCWSMGMMLWELMAGEKVRLIYREDARGNFQFSEDQYMELVRQISRHSGLSLKARRTILSLIDLDPKNRPSAREVLRQDFFQVPQTPGSKGRHFQFQIQHQKEFQALAEKERLLDEQEVVEVSEKRRFRKPRVVKTRTRTRETNALRREIRLSGLEVKRLQAKMELEDLYAEVDRLENKMPAVLDHMRKDEVDGATDALYDYVDGATDAQDARIAVTKRDRALKILEVEHMKIVVQLMQQKNDLIKQFDEAQRNGLPQLAISSLKNQIRATNAQLRLNDVEYQLNCLRAEEAYFTNHPDLLTEKQQARAAEIPLLIQEKSDELLQLRGLR